MRAWKFVAVLAVMISVLSLYQLSFTLKSNSEDKKAKKMALRVAEDQKLLNPAVNTDSIVAVETKSYLDENWDKETYLGFSLKKVKQYALNLGLDLQGGTHATVIVSPDDILTRMSGNSQDPDFTAAVEKAKARMSSSQSKFTDIFLEEWRSIAKDRELNEIFLSSDNNKITLETSDDEILKMIDVEMVSALSRSVTVLRSRIDEFGASNPIIHPVESTGRIEIELPGIDNEEKIRTQIERVAKLEFVQPHTSQKFGETYQALSSYFRAIEADSKKEEAVIEEETPNIVDGDAIVDTVAKSENDSIEAAVAKAKADSLSSGPQTEFERIFNPQQQGFYIVKTGDYDRAKQILASKEVKKILPKDITFMFDKNNVFDLNDGSKGYGLHLMKKGDEAPVLLDGAYVEDAYVTRDGSGKIAVGIQFSSEGGTKWSNLTEEFKGEIISIVLDDEIFSMPRIIDKMPGGSCIITGNFDYEEASELANILKAGKLPAPTIIERLVKVGPSLGAEAISQGLYSLLAGLALVVFFMIFYYNKAGFVAVIALFFNLFFIVGILATPSFAVTLTLPGIAGIVLTIGMAIDANVLIFERIREELAFGKRPEDAIESGYSRAFWTIFDANITTFLSALVLYKFGTGLVQGFAVTLMIGVVCSFFAAVFITRLIIFLMGRNNGYQNIKFSTGFSKNLFKDKVIDFIGKRKMGYIFSAVVILAGLGLMAKDGLNLGVALKGGYSYVYKFKDAVTPGQAKTALKALVGDAEVQVKTYDGNDKLSITTSYLIEEGKPETAKTVRGVVEKALSQFGEIEQLKSTEVGATIADDIKSTSIESVIIALIVIFLYIVFRFRKWQFGLGSLAALFHDVLFVLSVFAIARMLGFAFEIEEVFIAAILTLVGYSINDTVVVFDRIRENLGVESKVNVKEALNNSLNSTLSRTLVTSITTLLVVIVLFVFGGEALRGFSFALLIGVIIGTYSSIFIATPIVYDTMSKSLDNKSAE